jgi:DNA-binding transcriptional LysR family regulator
MDIQSLRYLVALSETENVRRAAALLKISPPALSKSMKQLEGVLGYPIAVRSGRNIVLTDRARSLSRRARSLVHEFDRLRAEEETPTEVKPIRIVTFEVFSTYFLQSLGTPAWQDRRFVLHEAGPGGIERAIQEGQADYGITYLPVPAAGLVYDKVLSIEMGVFVRKGAFPSSEQPDLPFVVPAMPLHGTPSRVRGLDGWPDDAYPRQVRYQVTFLESALELIRNGWCAGYFPVFIAEAHNRRVRPEWHLERRYSPYGGRKCFTDVHLIRRKSDPEDRTYRQLAKAIRINCKAI